MQRRSYFLFILMLLVMVFSLAICEKLEASTSKKYAIYVQDNYGSPELGPVMLDMLDDGAGNLLVTVTLIDDKSGDLLTKSGTGIKSGNSITFTLPVIICSDTNPSGSGVAVFTGIIDSNGNINGSFINTLSEGDICRINSSNIYQGNFRAIDITNMATINIGGTYNFYFHPGMYPGEDGPHRLQISQNGNIITVYIPEKGKIGQGNIYGNFVTFRIPVILCEDTCFQNGYCPEPDEATFVGNFDNETNTIIGHYGDGVPAGDYCHYPGNNTYITPAEGTWRGVRTLICDSPFIDITCDRQFFNEIKWMKDRGISRGYSDGTYRPYEPVTRAAMAVFIVRIMYGDDFTYPTTPYFIDVPPEHQFFKYIQKFKELGLTRGCNEDGTMFCPENNVRREEMAVFLVRAKVGDEFTYNETPYFSDVPQSYYFFKYIQKFKELGITTGYPDGTYKPSENVKRDAIAAFLYRAFGK